MTQSELDRAVAHATGETVTTIRELGFDMADPDVVHHDPEPTDLDARTIDWDALDARRVSLLPQRRWRELALASAASSVSRGRHRCI